MLLRLPGIEPHILPLMRVAKRRSLSGTVSRTAGWLVAFAVLAQALAAIPLALHFAAAAGLDNILAAMPLCGGSAGDRPDTGGQTGEDHQHCLAFCQGVFGAPAVLPGAVLSLIAAEFAAVIFAARRLEYRAVGRMAGYVTRGPPLAAA